MHVFSYKVSFHVTCYDLLFPVIVYMYIYVCVLLLLWLFNTSIQI